MLDGRILPADPAGDPERAVSVPIQAR